MVERSYHGTVEGLKGQENRHLRNPPGTQTTLASPATQQRVGRGDREGVTRNESLLRRRLAIHTHPYRVLYGCFRARKNPCYAAYSDLTTQ